MTGAVTRSTSHKVDELPGICISLWRHLSVAAAAAAATTTKLDAQRTGEDNVGVQLDERGLLHVNPDRFGRTFVTELADFCDYWINVKRKAEVLYYAEARWKRTTEKRPSLSSSSVAYQSLLPAPRNKFDDGAAAVSTTGSWVVALEFPEWVTNATELPDSYIFDTVYDERFKPVILG